MTEIYRNGTLVVWFYERGDGKSTGPISRSTFLGQDLGGYPGREEYEYFFHVDPDGLRRALGAEGDLIEAVKARAEEIVGIGEMRWLKAHGVEYDFHSY